MIEIEIPMRTPTLNEWQRMHWGQRKRIGKEIATHIHLACVLRGVRRPHRPIARCRIEIERESTREPDFDGMVGGLKPLLDALQPASKRHPYGLGFIADDGPRCVVGFDAKHIAGKGARTIIRITEAA